MWGANTFKQGGLQGRGFIELLMLQHAQGFAHDFAFIGIAAGVNEPFDKLAEGRWQVAGR